MPLRFDQVSGGIVVDPPLLLRAFFLLATCAILLVNFTPALRERFLAYGSRTPLSPPTKHVPRKGAVASYSSRLETLVLSHLDYLSSLQLPHRYFLHFYIVSVTLSLFWATVFLCGINVEAFLSSAFAISIEVPAKSTMTVGQIALGWILMSVQGLRRLYECVAFAKPSKAKMWIGHWVLGILFYVGMSCAIWVDGIQSLRDALFSHEKLYLGYPSFIEIVSLVVFFVASAAQHEFHRYLASLNVYTLPSHPQSQRVLCPHYTAECSIYLALAILAAPPGYFINLTLLSAVLFASINLGITANSTRNFYLQKFGEERVRGRWRMLAFVY